MNWLKALSLHAEKNTSCVLVTIVELKGSAPRVVGTKMVVSLNDIADTLGGGALELEAIEHARTLLNAPTSEPLISHKEFALGTDLTQCCGGRVKLQFDCQWASDFSLQVFGAGHVAQEVARIVQRLPCRATFHDARSEWLEKLKTCIDGGGASSHASINTRLVSENPYAYVESCPANAYYAVMTHSHELDMELVEAILARGDARYCGLIASDSKAVSFRSRLKRKGFTHTELEGLTAPMGLHFKTGNTPMEVAIAMTADVLHIHQQKS